MRYRTLIDILKACGISQQQIADRLGIAKTAISQWAHEVRPMPHKHELVLLAWAEDAQARALADARARDKAAAPRRRPTSLLGSEHPEEELLQARLDFLWNEYNWACIEEEGHGLTTAIIAQAGKVGALGDADPQTTTFKPEDIERLLAEANRLRRFLSQWKRVHTPPQGGTYDS
jgi:transcriptional regulator with XRE-family HTH domain